MRGRWHTLFRDGGTEVPPVLRLVPWKRHVVWRMKEVNVVLVCRIHEARNVRKKHYLCCCIGKMLGSTGIGFGHVT